MKNLKNILSTKISIVILVAAISLQNNIYAQTQINLKNSDISIQLIKDKYLNDTIYVELFIFASKDLLINNAGYCFRNIFIDNYQNIEFNNGKCDIQNDFYCKQVYFKKINKGDFLKFNLSIPSKIEIKYFLFSLPYILYEDIPQKKLFINDSKNNIYTIKDQIDLYNNLFYQTPFVR